MEPSEAVGQEPCVIAEALDAEKPPVRAFRGSQTYVIGRSRFEKGNVGWNLYA